jgi:DNA processing protein
MATGPDSIYPYRHKGFADELCRIPGCALITDYPVGTAPLAIHFLRRNRIIAGLSDSTILIESKIKGGGMMTSRLAFSYDRDVYALPGRVDDIRSQGCNKLIKDKIAEPLTSIDELMASLHLSRRRCTTRESLHQILEQRFGNSDARSLDMMEEALGIIRSERGIMVEDISLKTGWDYRTTSNITMMLETEGLISMDLLQRCTINTKLFR